MDLEANLGGSIVVIEPITGDERMSAPTNTPENVFTTPAGEVLHTNIAKTRVVTRHGVNNVHSEPWITPSGRREEY